ncbi:hypothetical protein [Agromyces sp. SYSU T0242]|uniref:hypothetical protein n=1 Tax=Agromyces litoreus TaxID=3158561 RepID=UPI003392085C
MDPIGGGVLVAVAATLWIAYLLPSWLRRRQYLSTERNAVRLQQTLRILAETAEAPEEVRVGVTAREVAAQERILHEHELAARLEAQAAENRAIAERLAAEEAAAAAERELEARAERAAAERAAAERAAAAAARATRGHDAGSRATRARRSRRRRRAACTLLLLASLMTVPIGVIVVAGGGSVTVVLAGVGGIAAAMTGLVALGRAASAPVAVVPAPPRVAEPFEPIEVETEPAEGGEGWTPHPLPKPLHLSRGTIAASVMASIAEAEQLKRAAADAELAERAVRMEPKVPVLRPPAASADQAPTQAAGDAATRRPAASASEPENPYARMGIVEGAEPGLGDLDQVLRRRRTAV